MIGRKLTMKAIIIEDEKPSARRLQRMLEKLEVKIDHILHSVEDSVTWFRNNKHPELIFLDVQLSDGLSFEIFEAVEIRSAVIFTTAYDQYALKAFKLNSIDYLLKPIDEEELEKALEKFNSTRATPAIFDAAALRAMLTLNSGTAYKKRITIQVGQHIKIIETEDVSCFYSENKGTYVHSGNDRSYLMDCSLDKLEPDLDPAVFFRVSRKFIINLRHIRDIITFSNQRLEVKLHNFKDQQVIVSRERVKEFRQWLE